MAISGSKSKISLKPKNVKSNLSPTYVKRLKIALLKKKENSRSVQQTIPHSASKVKLKDKKPIAIDARQRLESAHFRLVNIIVFIIWILLKHITSRYLNEKLYTKSSSEAWKLFKEDPQSFDVYHKGFKNQVLKWPVNPLDMIISDLLNR